MDSEMMKDCKEELEEIKLNMGRIKQEYNKPKETNTENDIEIYNKHKARLEKLSIFQKSLIDPEILKMYNVEV